MAIAVYIKQVELSRFKSFGNTTVVPFLPGFTVISGPNGSGKSNILDALLFALGLSSSKGMRADRLPDLVNAAHAKRGRTAEASVTVTFALDDDREWKVTRRLRVTDRGTYTSTYYSDEVPCTLSELHERLAALHIYPEGYNVVLQGDVTGIISMNPRERREIIDELAGVGEFDRKIAQAKEKLDEVKAGEERFRIVERELQQSLERLAADRVKAEKYRQLRQQCTDLDGWETVLHHRQLTQNYQAVAAQLQQWETAIAEGTRRQQELQEAVRAAEAYWTDLNQRARQLGEEEHVALTAAIAGQQAELRALQQRDRELGEAYRRNQERVTQLREEIEACGEELQGVAAQRETLAAALVAAEAARQQQVPVVERCQAEVAAIAERSAAWVRQQTELYEAQRRVQEALAQQQQEEARWMEAERLRSEQREAQQQELAAIEAQIPGWESEYAQIKRAAEGARNLSEIAQRALGEAQLDVQTCRETIDRLTQEHRQKARQLDKLEAQVQAEKEIQGTRVAQIIQDVGIEGVYGLVAELGRVTETHRLALEVAAGSRLSHLVVANDEVAAEAIALLKRERAGRATFLPLNQLRPSPALPPLDPKLGAIAYALNLVEFEPQYTRVFAFVFGNTLVFEDLEAARPHIGRYRMVTLDGELLETSGAITGGSVRERASTLHFGVVEPPESQEARQLRERLQELDRMLGRLQQKLRAEQARVEKAEAEVRQAREAQAQTQQQRDRLQARLQEVWPRREALQAAIQQHTDELARLRAQRTGAQQATAVLQAEYQARQEALAALATDDAHAQWQQAQALLQRQAEVLQEKEAAVRRCQQDIEANETQFQRLEAKLHRYREQLQELRANQTQQLNSTTQLRVQIRQHEERLARDSQQLAALEKTVGAVRAERDTAERTWRLHQAELQQLTWELEQHHHRRSEGAAALLALETQLAQWVLPEPVPAVPADLTLEQLQHDRRRLQKQLQAMEPVNMRAIEDWEETQQRLADLSQRLTTLERERTELLLRIENFTTLRQRAFLQAFHAIDAHFQEIFAELSDGDGHLQLEDPSNPLNGGLNLVAHPKGKPVRHLASMSGGEKSLTALSFIFALQRYRPSPFYALDEVDMFLDGANVERLAAMMRQQSRLTQFIVVSLRRPTIEAADRTIGVTQARGAHTQVLGLELKSS